MLIQAKSLTLCSSERGLECFSATLKALAFAGAVYLLLALILSKELGTPTNLWVSTHITNNGLIHLVLTSIAFAFFKKGCRTFLYLKQGPGQKIYFCNGEDGSFHAEGFISCIHTFFD